MWTEITRPQYELSGLRYGQRIRAVAPTMGRRTDVRMVLTQPAPRQGLRENHRKRRGMAPDRQHPTPHTENRKGLKSMNSFRVRL